MDESFAQFLKFWNIDEKADKFCIGEQKKKVCETFTSKSFAQKLNNSGVGLRLPKILEYLQ